ncbi:MAG: AAA family ATPase [Gammaproteobacteria bacterium]
MNDDIQNQMRQQAIELAAQMQHRFVTVEHLLLTIVEDEYGDACQALLHNARAEFNANILKTDLQLFLERQSPKRKNGEAPKPTMGFERVLERARRIVRDHGRLRLTAADMLISIFYEQESKATHLMNKQGVTRHDINDYLTRTKQEAAAEPQAESKQQFVVQVIEKTQEQKKATAHDNTLLENLNEKYRQGRLSPLVGRTQEIQAMMRVLSQSRKSNPILVGDPGTGKTTLAAGLAQIIEDGNAPPLLQSATVYALNVTALLAGTQYRGDFEQRLKRVMDILQRDPHAILFIDEIHIIIGAGSTTGSTMDVANMLKPALASGELRCIGATTYKEYRNIFEKDEALARRFQKIDILEPTEEEAIHIIQGLKSRFENHHHLTISDEVIKSAVQLSKKYIKKRCLPDIAIDLIDEAGAEKNLSNQHDTALSISDVEAVVAAKTRVPIEKMTLNEQDVLKHLAQNLKTHIYGQDVAVDTLVSAVRTARAGLRDPDKPIGSFLFAGPTGVGKTELSKQLAEHLGLKLIRFDMSEYNEKHQVSKLIGSPPGYVGHEEGGLLTEAVNKDPNAVVLLDEIEKAHSDIYNLLLQVMDHGTLTDSHGRKSDFRHVILIMTTNAGAEFLGKRSIGFIESDNKNDSKLELARVFTPEFRNRFDEIVSFNSLPKEVMHDIVRKHVKQLQHMLESRGVSLSLTEDAFVWFANHGYDSQMGARPMGRLVTNQLKKPLAEELLYGKLSQGGYVIVDAIGNELIFQYEEG